MTKVFVYGSLKSGCWNNHILGDSKLIGEDETSDLFVLTDCGFPYMVPERLCEGLTEHPCLPVKGEVYEVTEDDVLISLDALEGVAYGHYRHFNTSTREGHDVVCYVPCEPEMALKYKLCSEDMGVYLWD